MNTEDYARQFRLEAAVLASLHHPNLPRAIDYIFSEDGGEYMVMEYCTVYSRRDQTEQIQMHVQTFIRWVPPCTRC